MPQVGAWLVAVWTGASAAGAAGAFLLKTAASIALNMAVSKLMSPGGPRPQEIATEAKSSNAQRIRHLGRVRASGALMFWDWTNIGGTRRLFKLIAVAEGGMEDVHQWYLNGEAVEVDADGYVTTEPWNKGNIRLRFRKGIQGDQWDGGAFTALRDAFPDHWTVDHRLRGVGCFLATFDAVDGEDIANVYSGGEPEVSALISGAPQWRPISEDWSQTRAAAVLLGDVLTNPGYGAMTADDLDLPSLTAATGACTAPVPTAGGTRPRYQAGISYALSDGLKDTAQKLLDAMGGRAWITPEGKMAMQAGVWAEPATSVTGGTVSRFTRDGVDYVQVLWRQSGSFMLSGDVDAQWALVGGGASGGQQNLAPGGGGAGWLEQGSSLESGTYDVSIGAGAVGAEPGVNKPGNSGSASSILRNSAAWIAAPGGGAGGGGGGIVNGASGGNGGGGAGSAGSAGIGGEGDPGYNDGDAFNSGTAAERAGGGGAGAGGDGQDGTPGDAGNGAPGITLAWTEPPMDICGGGGASSSAPSNGAATHGGTPGARGEPSADAENGGGSGGSTAGTGKGGDGFFVLVVPADQASALYLNTIEERHIVEMDYGAGTERINRVTTLVPTYVAPEVEWQESTADPWDDTAAIARWGEGEPKGVDLLAVQHHGQARHVSKQMMAVMNPARRMSMKLRSSGLRLIGERVCAVNIPRLGLNSAPFWIDSFGWDGTNVTVDLIEADPSSFDWTAAEEGSPPAVPDEIDREPPAITTPITSVTVVTDDGAPYIRITGTLMAVAGYQIVAQYRRVSDRPNGAWTNMVRETAPAGQYAFRTQPLADRQDYDIRTFFGFLRDGEYILHSTPVVVLDIDVVANNNPPAAPVIVSQSGSAGGTLTVTFMPDLGANYRRTGLYRAAAGGSWANATFIKWSYDTSSDVTMTAPIPGAGARFWLQSENPSEVKSDPIEVGDYPA